MPSGRLYSREELARFLWQRGCVFEKNLETASVWRSIDGQHWFTVPEIVDGEKRSVTSDDLLELEVDLEAEGLKKR
jgi:hypothetical protein